MHKLMNKRWNRGWNVPRRTQHSVWDWSGELPVAGGRRVKTTRRHRRELVASRGWESGHATCRGESRSSRCTQPWVRQKKWRRGRRRTVIITVTHSDTNLELEFLCENHTFTTLYCFLLNIYIEYKEREGQLFTMTQYNCPLNKAEIQ